MPARNNQTRLVTHNGRTLTILQWSQETGISQQTILSRLDRLKWSPARALQTPPNTKFSRSPGRPNKDAPRSPPKLQRHKKGQAFARWMEAGKNRQRYFGPWGSPKAREAYAAFLVEWARGVALPQQQLPQVVAGSVGALVGRWLDHAKVRYVKFGRQTSEYHCHRAACSALMSRFPTTAVAAFGLEQLEAVRTYMVDFRGWSRKTVNKHVARLVAMFGWGVPRKLVPSDVHYALLQIEPLTPGATTARETVPVRSAPVSSVERLLGSERLHRCPDRRRVLAGMIRTQCLTGMRPGELCAMYVEHLDRSASEWKYTVPAAVNKNFHRTQPRVIWLGPRAQAVLAPFVAAAEAGRHAVFAFPRERRKDDGPRPVARSEYARLIKAACQAVGVAPWHPHQLRHNKATEVKRIYESDEAAARAIGTSEDVAARIYTDPQETVDRRIAREAG